MASEMLLGLMPAVRIEECPDDSSADLDRGCLIPEARADTGHEHRLCGRRRGRSHRLPAWQSDAVLSLAQRHPASPALRTLPGAGLCWYGQFRSRARRELSVRRPPTLPRRLV